MHLVDLAHDGRIVLEKRLAQADRAERFGVGFHEVATVGRDDLRAAAADIDDEYAFVALGPNALHAEVNEARLFTARNDFDGGAHRFRRARQKLALIARVANGAGGDDAHAHHVQFAVGRGHACEHGAGGLHGLFADRTAAEHAFAQSGDFAI